MFNEHRKSIQWGNETLTLETGKVARQADGTVIARFSPGVEPGDPRLVDAVKALA